MKKGKAWIFMALFLALVVFIVEVVLEIDLPGLAWFILGIPLGLLYYQLERQGYIK